VRDLGRLKHDDPERYENIKAAAIADTRRRLARNTIGRVVADLYAELMATDALPGGDPETAAGSEA
jgi:hypothetical protein